MHWIITLSILLLRGSTVSATSSESSLSSNTSDHSLDLSSYCDAQFSSYTSTYDPSGKFTTSTRTWYQGYDNAGNQTGHIVTQSYATSTYTFTYEGYMAYQRGGAKPPCCNKCRMSAGTIEFFFWPDLATATAPITSGEGQPHTAIASNGFIFTSPSVYMAFSSLYAHNWCSAVGETWQNTTIGFHPDEISTIQVYQSSGIGHKVETFLGTRVVTIDTLEGTRLPPAALKYSDLAQNCSTISGYEYFPDNPQNADAGGWEHDACHPVLALPPSLLKMQKAWEKNDCQALDGYGAYDPPVALTEASSEVKPTLRPQPGGTSNPGAAPVTTSVAALPDMVTSGTAETSTNVQSIPPVSKAGGGQENEAAPDNGASPSSSTHIGDYIMSAINPVGVSQADTISSSGASTSVALSATGAAHSSSTGGLGTAPTQTSGALTTTSWQVRCISLIILAVMACR